MRLFQFFRTKKTGAPKHLRVLCSSVQRLQNWRINLWLSISPTKCFFSDGLWQSLFCSQMDQIFCVWWLPAVVLHSVRGSNLDSTRLHNFAQRFISSFRFLVASFVGVLSNIPQVWQVKHPLCWILHLQLLLARYMACLSPCVCVCFPIYSCSEDLQSCLGCNLAGAFARPAFMLRITAEYEPGQRSRGAQRKIILQDCCGPITGLWLRSAIAPQKTSRWRGQRILDQNSSVHFDSWKGPDAERLWREQKAASETSFVRRGTKTNEQSGGNLQTLPRQTWCVVLS